MKVLLRILQSVNFALILYFVKKNYLFLYKEKALLFQLHKFIRNEKHNERIYFC